MNKKIEVKVVSKEELKDADFCLCIPKAWESNFKDNLVDKCFFCKQEVYFRPYIPRSLKKVCMECADKVMDYKKN